MQWSIIPAVSTAPAPGPPRMRRSPTAPPSKPGSTSSSPSDEAIFGFGSHEEGYGNLRGRSRELYQQNMKAVAPTFVSTRGYALLFDCGSLMTFHDDALGSYWWADAVDELDFYLLAGDTFDDLTRANYQLTGAPPPASPLGLRLLPVQGALRQRAGDARRRTRVPPPPASRSMSSCSTGNPGPPLAAGVRSPSTPCAFLHPRTSPPSSTNWACAS